MDTALVVACISGAVALGSAGLSGWTQLKVVRLQARSKEEERRSEAKVVLDRKRVRDSLSATAPTWAFSVSACYVIQDDPVHIP